MTTIKRFNLRGIIITSKLETASNPGFSLLFPVEEVDHKQLCIKSHFDP